MLDRRAVHFQGLPEPHPRMKTLLAPATAVLLCTALTVWSCHAVGMSKDDLAIAACVTFVVSATAAFGATAVARSREKRKVLTSQK